MKSAVDRVLIYVRSQREWYFKPNRGTTKNAAEAHRYIRWRAERLIGTDADLEIQDANTPPAQSSELKP